MTRRSRLAPSPTGAMHLGNIRTFLVNWALARAGGWELIMRMEDLDGPRIRAESAARLLDDLRWLGLDWDGPVRTQSDDLAPYASALRRLAETGEVFRSDATRREIAAAASAPHAGDHETRFPASLRPALDDPDAWRIEDLDHGYRLKIAAGQRSIADRFAGTRAFDVSEEVGDLLVWTKRGTPTYQLAVTVDDGVDGVTDVVRGDDLLSSAARQAILHERLATPEPTWWHVPLVVGSDGRRLAKRHGDTRIAEYRARGCAPDRIVGWVAATAGLDGPRRPMSAKAFADAFDPDRLPREAIVFTETDHRWLLSDD